MDLLERFQQALLDIAEPFGCGCTPICRCFEGSAGREMVYELQDLAREALDFQKPRKTKMANIDNVTLLQLEAGVRIYLCRFFSNDTPYAFKSQEEIEPGSFAIVHTNKGKAEEADTPHSFSIVRVVREADDWEPVPGLTYTWIVQVLDVEQLITLPDGDKAARKKLRLGAAIAEAKSVADGLNVQLLPAPKKRRKA